ncbi:Phosphatidylglycerophosphatase and protein-tyrosine phosphatase 1 [Mortierella sp. AD011]|nr:Phosphatidylglycerophosphatase and protein-tyrosine phosphatase 1 [Mortierella sp. AD010]KAF9388730.1 Phosphatidylglycerophosphatase and protein-tyrosine phosphatase 1 [Mortierella sp. AD011]
MQELGLVQCWIPTRDFQTPSLESIWTGVRFISKCEARRQGLGESKRGSLYIHCKAGRGRSATVVLCWLLFAYKLIPEQAQLVLLKARAQVDKDIYLHPEVVSFYDQVLEQENNNDIVRIDWPDSQ